MVINGSLFPRGLSDQAGDIGGVCWTKGCLHFPAASTTTWALITLHRGVHSIKCVNLLWYSLPKIFILQLTISNRTQRQWHQGQERTTATQRSIEDAVALSPRPVHLNVLSTSDLAKQFCLAFPFEDVMLAMWYPVLKSRQCQIDCVSSASLSSQCYPFSHIYFKTFQELSRAL